MKADPMNDIILRINDLSKSYPSRAGEVKAIERVAFDVRSGSSSLWSVPRDAARRR